MKAHQKINYELYWANCSGRNILNYRTFSSDCNQGGVLLGRRMLVAISDCWIGLSCGVVVGRELHIVDGSRGVGYHISVVDHRDLRAAGEGAKGLVPEESQEGVSRVESVANIKYTRG